MLHHWLLSLIENIDPFATALWGYLVLPLLLLVGIWLTLFLRFPQIREFYAAWRIFFTHWRKNHNTGQRGVAPLHAFFTSIGGCIGVANLVAVCEMLREAGAGAVFWMWIAAFIGMSVKYSEVYLSIALRKKSVNGYRGGGMWLIEQAFPNSIAASFFALLFCTYSTEIYLFQESVKQLHPLFQQSSWEIQQLATVVIIGLLLIGIIYASLGGVDRVGKITTAVVPIFVLLFLLLSSWILWQQRAYLLPSFRTIFREAFSLQPNPVAMAKGVAAGGIITCLHPLLLRMRAGLQRGCYSGDIGVGYAGMIYAQTQEKSPKKGAQMAILEIFIDTFLICTLTLMIVLVSQIDLQINTNEKVMITEAFHKVGVPYTDYFMPVLILLVAYSTLLSFFLAGMESACYLSPTYGKKSYLCYGTIMFILFSFARSELALNIMSICGAGLLLLQLAAIVKLRAHLPKNKEA